MLGVLLQTIRSFWNYVWFWLTQFILNFFFFYQRIFSEKKICAKCFLTFCKRKKKTSLCKRRFQDIHSISFIYYISENIFLRRSSFLSYDPASCSAWFIRYTFHFSTFKNVSKTSLRKHDVLCLIFFLIISYTI